MIAELVSLDLTGGGALADRVVVTTGGHEFHL